MKLVVWCPSFFSRNDEAALFGWLNELRFISYKGVGRELHLTLARRPSVAQLRDLLALFRRYKLAPMSQLAILRSPKNESWFADPSADWFAAVFGENAHVPLSHEELQRDASRLMSLVGGKAVKTVWRHRPRELGIEFEDGTRLLVDKTETGLELSVT